MIDQTRTIRRCSVLGMLLLGVSANLGAQTGSPAAIAVVSGSGQRTGVDEFFPNSLVALVTDGSGNPVPNVTVNFAGPNTEGAPTCDFLDTGTPAISVLTDASGMASSFLCIANSVAGGPYNVAATVAGAPGAANFSLTNFPSTAITTTNLSSSLNPSTLSQSVTFTATVTPAGVAGTVTFSFGTILLGTVPLTGAGLATLTTNLLPAGSAPLTAAYSGDSTHLPSTFVLFQTVNSAPASGFAPAINSAIGPSPGSAATGDFNGDGIADMAVVNGGNQVTILLSNGSGGFTPAPNSPFPASGAQAVAVGDFNGDGKTDLAIAESTGNTIAVMFGDGNGGFTQGPIFSLSANASPVGLAVADFNGDGLADLAVADSGTNDVAVLLGNGAGGFTQASGSPFPAGQTPSAVAVGDFNGDGWADVAVASTTSNDVTILFGNGVGGFAPAPGSPVPADGFPSSIAVGDFNGDGIADLAVANAGGADVTVILGSGFGTLAQASWSPVAVGQAPYSIAAGDFNGDGNLDFAVTNYTSPGTAAAFLGNGNGGFNNEGFTLLRRAAGRRTESASRRKKSRDFTPAPQGPVAVGGNPVFIAAADLNSDGKTDLAVVNSTDNNVSVLLGVQSATLTINAACPATVGVVDQEYSFTVSASGGVFPLSWALTGGNLPEGLQFNQQTGVISGFVFETGTFPITVTVSDSAVGGLRQTATYQCSIVISALPVLSAAPAQVSFTSLQGATPAPQSVNVSSVGQSVAFTASAAVNAFSGAPWLGVTVAPPGTTNQTIVLKVLNPPPGTPAGAYTGDIAISAPAANNPAVTVPVTWTVIPLLTVTAACPATGGILTLPYSFAVAVIGGSPPYNWTLTSGPLPPGLSLNTATGVIGGTPSSTGVFPIAVQIVDSGRGTLRQSVTYQCSITIVSQPTVTAACPATGGVQGSPYSFTVGVAGGGPQYAWTLINGSLPPGLTLNTGTGLISGTPLKGGTFPITVQITNFGAGVPQQSVTYTCSIVIAPQLTVIAACPALSGAQGSIYSFIVGAAGGTPTYTWILSDPLPPGLQLNSSSGAIGGVPTTAGTFPIAILISDSGVGAFHQTVTYSCTMVITPPALAIASACPGNGIEGLSYGPFHLSASGGLGPGSYILSIVNGALPAGVTLKSDLIGGTPSGPPGVSNFSIQVTSGSQTASLPCSVTIAPALPQLQIGGTCPPNSFPIGSAVSLPLSATGGQAPYTFRLTSGPSWLTLNSQGSAATLAGKPPTAGSFPFSVTLTDSVNSKPAVFSCTIIATSSTLKVAGTCPGQQVEEVAFSIPLTAGGGQGPYNWSYSSGPSWLKLTSATGTATSLSGTPPQVTGQQTFPFTVTLNDSVNSAPATFTCTVTVNPPPLKIAASGSCPTAALARPASFSISFAGSGGIPPYTWTLASPSWLTLSTATGPATSIAGAPPADGNFPFTLTLQDSAKTVPATFGCTLPVSTPIPPPTVSAGPAPPTLQDPLTGGSLNLAAATPVQLTGEIQLSFTADAFGVTDNPQVQFSPPGQGRTFMFTMPAGSETIPLPSIQQGDVAGTIHIELVSLLDGTRSVLPDSHPSADYPVHRIAPVITDLELQNQTSGGFTIVLAGYSTPRDMTSVMIVFTAAAGATINGTAQFTISLNDLFTAFYQSPNSVMSGSAFTNLQIPVTIQGDVSAIGSVGVSLTNSIGTSNVVSKSP